MRYWAAVRDDDLSAVQALFAQRPVDELHTSFIVLLTADDAAFVLAHSVARLCKALTELLDDIDADTTPSPCYPEAGCTELVDMLPVFEVDSLGSAVEALLEFLVLWLENGPPSILARPLAAPLQHLVAAWEWEFLQRRAFGPKPSRPSTAASLVAMMPFVSSRSDNRGPPMHLSPPAISPLMQLMRVADFLAVEPLRDLACAFLATLVMDHSEVEVAQLLDMERPLTDEELEPMYQQHPFLRPMDDAAPE